MGPLQWGGGGTAGSVPRVTTRKDWQGHLLRGWEEKEGRFVKPEVWDL